MKKQMSWNWKKIIENFFVWGVIIVLGMFCLWMCLGFIVYLVEDYQKSEFCEEVFPSNN